jgi:hypothetical protein
MVRDGRFRDTSQGMMPVAAGLAVGLGACLALGRLLRSQLYELGRRSTVNCTGITWHSSALTWARAVAAS